jgi:hypothetical protein
MVRVSSGRRAQVGVAVRAIGAVGRSGPASGPAAGQLVGGMKPRSGWGRVRPPVPPGAACPAVPAPVIPVRATRDAPVPLARTAVRPITRCVPRRRGMEHVTSPARAPAPQPRRPSHRGPVPRGRRGILAVGVTLRGPIVPSPGADTTAPTSASAPRRPGCSPGCPACFPATPAARRCWRFGLGRGVSICWSCCSRACWCGRSTAPRRWRALLIGIDHGRQRGGPVVIARDLPHRVARSWGQHRRVERRPDADLLLRCCRPARAGMAARRRGACCAGGPALRAYATRGPIRETVPPPATPVRD